MLLGVGNPRRRNRRRDRRSPAELAGPSGLYHRGIQFTAPNKRKREQLRIAVARRRRPPSLPRSPAGRRLSNASRRAMTALRCAGDSASRSRNSAVPCSSSRIVCTKASISRRSLTSAAAALRVDVVEQLRQAIERVLMAGEEDLFLVLEVVVEIPLLHVQRRGDLLRPWRRDSRAGGTPWRRFSGCRRGSRPAGSAFRGRFRRRRGRAWRLRPMERLTRSLPQL